MLNTGKKLKVRINGCHDGDGRNGGKFRGENRSTFRNSGDQMENQNKITGYQKKFPSVGYYM